MDAVWKVLNQHFFSRWIGPEDSVIDVGAGLCNFINNIAAERRVAFDADPSVASRTANGVEAIVGTKLSEHNLSGQFDVAFVSNFLEHMRDGDAVVSTLREIKEVLKPNGRILILQPIFELVGPKYFDFIDHKTILTFKSLIEALELAEFRVTHTRKRFLPYTSKSNTPRHPLLVRLYLLVPLAQWLMAGQAFCVAQNETT